ncbi:MAG: 2Fe-2S iron-sulfur cluster-binding protein [Acidimicrobiia bacterium]|nr:2Fe-2S iron-sulfur cluster-binding protein [Acidimicrobiia bacterium]
MRIAINVDGDNYEADVEPRVLLVHFLSDVARTTSTHIGCDTSNCGSCTVLVDGEAVKACNVLAVQADGRRVTTVDGLVQEPARSLAERVLKQLPSECGYCGPGIVMTALGLLHDRSDLDTASLRAGLEGNICRCTGYVGIVDAIVETAGEAQPDAWGTGGS